MCRGVFDVNIRNTGKLTLGEVNYKIYFKMSFDVFFLGKLQNPPKVFFLFPWCVVCGCFVAARGSCMSRGLSLLGEAVSEVLWCRIAQEELNHAPAVTSRVFLSLFGVSPSASSLIFNKYLSQSPHCLPRCLLWTLYFCFNYPKYQLSAIPFRKCNVRTFSETVWGVLQYLSGVFDEVIIFDSILIFNNLFKGKNIKSHCQNYNYRHN